MVDDIKRNHIRVVANQLMTRRDSKRYFCVKNIVMVVFPYCRLIGDFGELLCMFILAELLTITKCFAISLLQSQKQQQK